ncbi:MAG: COG1361 S-layer family protein [Methanomicrobia archaeon]|nr:COG1361 S-layer family protein [Methanomicrobia archaeon]
MEMNKRYENMNRRKRLVSLCTLSLVFLLVFYSPLALLPTPSVVPASAASFSSVTITDVTPTTFNPGDTRAVIVTVSNNGGRDAKNIRLAFQGTEVLSPVGPTVYPINTLNSWSSKEITVTMHVKEEAPNGIYSVPVNCSWREYYFDPAEGYVTGPEQTALLGLSFNVVGEGVLNVGDVTTDPTTIRPGDENVEIRAAIENSGEAAAKDIEAQLVFDGDTFKPSWSGTDRSYLGRLNSGEKGEAVFHIDLAENIAAGTQSIPLRITYKDTKGTEYKVLRAVTILVKPKPDFEIVSYYTEPASISAADTGVVLHVQIKNVGSEKAESASVRMTGEADVPFDYDVKSDFLGNLKIDETGEAILKFDVDKDAVPKGYPMGIEIRCTGDRDLGDDNVYVFNKEINVEVSSSSSQEDGFSVSGFEVLFSLLALFFVFIVVELRRNGV